MGPSLLSNQGISRPHSVPARSPLARSHLLPLPSFSCASRFLLKLLVAGVSGSQGAIAGECIVGAADTPGAAQGVAVVGSYAYVADGAVGGLRVIDISDPASPAILGSIDTPGDAYDVAVSGSYAYVADDFSGLQAIDISDPASPEIVGSVGTAGGARNVAVVASYAYVANEFMGGLQVIDISNPTSPVIVGSVGPSSDLTGVAVAGPYAYVTQFVPLNHLLVIDISDPTSPAILGSTDTPGLARDVAAVDSYAYVADGSSGGLQVILAPCDPTAVFESNLPAAPHAEALIRPARPFPASETAMVPFWLQRATPVKLGIYDTMGRKVRSLADGVRSAGEHVVVWNGRDDAGRSVASGLYFARLSWPAGSSVARAAWVR